MTDTPVWGAEEYEFWVIGDKMRIYFYHFLKILSNICGFFSEAHADTTVTNSESHDSEQQNKNRTEKRKKRTKKKTELVKEQCSLLPTSDSRFYCTFVAIQGKSKWNIFAKLCISLLLKSSQASEQLALTQMWINMQGNTLKEKKFNGNSQIILAKMSSKLIQKSNAGTAAAAAAAR